MLYLLVALGTSLLISSAVQASLWPARENPARTSVK
jgi:hypothetical protein